MVHAGRDACKLLRGMPGAEARRSLLNGRRGQQRPEHPFRMRRRGQMWEGRGWLLRLGFLVLQTDDFEDFRHQKLDRISKQLISAKKLLQGIDEARRQCLRELSLRTEFIGWVREALGGAAAPGASQGCPEADRPSLPSVSTVPGQTDALCAQEHGAHVSSMGLVGCW